MQTPLGAALLRHYGLDPQDPTSWLFLDNGKPYFDFEAVLRACRTFGGWARLLFVLRVLPRPARNWLYKKLAQNRYRIFGRGDMCALPDPDFQKRLLQ